MLSHGVSVITNFLPIFRHMIKSENFLYELNETGEKFGKSKKIILKCLIHLKMVKNRRMMAVFVGNGGYILYAFEYHHTKGEPCNYLLRRLF